MKEKSAGVVLFKGNKVLLLKKENGNWELPKGHIEEGEDEKEAAIRETKEETGINNFRILDGWKRKINYSYWLKKKKIEKEVTFFIGVAFGNEKPRPSKEHIDAMWINIENAINILKFENLKELLKDAKNFMEKNSILF